MTSICVVGLGYIGLPTAAVLARAGADVVGVDVSDRCVEAVNRGELPFVEAGLGAALSDAVARGRLRAQTEIPAADVYVVAVPTPLAPGSAGGHEADLSYIEAAARGIAPKLVGEELVVLESTSPPGTTEHLAGVVMKERPDLSMDGSGNRPTVHFAHCPERVLPGRIMTEMVTNPRVIGGLTPRAAELARELYGTFCEGELRLTDARTAEMTKLAENAFRDVNIAFANELSIIADRVGVDVWKLVELANLHPRVNILRPGPGVGGHCIAVDPWFIVSAAPEAARLIHTARGVNDSKPLHVIQHVRDAVADIVAGTGSPTIAALGLAFKADVDDLRESPALSVVRELAQTLPEARLLAADPNITELPAVLAPAHNIALVDYHTAIRAADVVVLLVDHRQFKALDRSLLDGKRVIDTRGAWR